MLILTRDVLSGNRQHSSIEIVWVLGNKV